MLPRKFVHQNFVHLANVHLTRRLPEAVSREMVRTYFEAPHYENILLSSAQGAPTPVTGRGGLSSKTTGARVAHLIAPEHRDLPMGVPLPTSSRRSHGHSHTDLQRGYTPRVVGATNFPYFRAVQPNSAGSWHSSGRFDYDSPGRVPGATNYTYNSGRVVGATNYSNVPGVQPRDWSSSTGDTPSRAIQSYQNTVSRNVETRQSQHRGTCSNGDDDSDFFYRPGSDR